MLELTWVGGGSGNLRLLEWGFSFGLKIKLGLATFFFSVKHFLKIIICIAYKK